MRGWPRHGSPFLRPVLWTSSLHRGIPSGPLRIHYTRFMTAATARGASGSVGYIDYAFGEDRVDVRVVEPPAISALLGRPEQFVVIL